MPSPLILEWKCAPTGGALSHPHHTAALPESHFPANSLRSFAALAIYEYPGTGKVVLGINGFRFEHPTVESAKADAVDRLQNNRGIYLQFA